MTTGRFIVWNLNLLYTIVIYVFIILVSMALLDFFIFNLGPFHTSELIRSTYHFRRTLSAMAGVNGHLHTCRHPIRFAENKRMGIHFPSIHLADWMVVESKQTGGCFTSDRP